MRTQHITQLTEFPCSFCYEDFYCEQDVRNLVELLQGLGVTGRFIQRKADVFGIEHENYDFNFPTWDELNKEIKSEQDATECLAFLIGLYNAQYQYLQELQQNISTQGEVIK